MLTALAEKVVRRRRWVLIAALVTFFVSGSIGGNVAKHLSTGGFSDPGAESVKVREFLGARFQGAKDPNVVLLVTATSGTVDDPQVVAAGVALTKEIGAETAVAGQAFSYFTIPGAIPLRSKDGKQALVLLTINGNEDQVRKQIDVLGPKYTRNGTLIKVGVGGYAEVFRQVGATIQHDLEKAEAIAIPITILLLLFVFRSAVAALLPLAIGALSVVSTFLMLRILTGFTQVSVFSLNLVTAMGLGLAIDYSLFVVSRYREELAKGHEPNVAVVRTVRTAGRTVLFSALTVAISLSALLVFPISFLKSFAYAGVAVVLIAATGAIVVLPAMLAALGHRIEKGAIMKKRRARSAKAEGQGFWHRIAVGVMRRPIPVATAVLAVLLILGTPFLHIVFGLPDDRVLPPSVSSRTVQDQIRANFASEEAGAVSILARGVDPVARAADVDAYAVAVSKLPGVARVDAATGHFLSGLKAPLPPDVTLARFASPAGTWLSAVPTVEPNSPEGEKLVKEIRALPSPVGAVQVGGPSAQLVDSKAALFAKMPLAGLIIALTTFVLLFLMTGSVLVPVKAVVLNLASLTATFGAMVWIFQDGHLARALGFTPTGTIDVSTPILMFCTAFGLSMDYEVFLLSRIKEEHDRTGDNVSSVALGLERTGRIVTAAALLLAVVFIAFSTSRVTFIKLFGLGLTLAVVMDATLIRGLLVPAFMRLAGEANWWAPAPLRRVYDRFGLKETVDDDRPAQVTTVADAIVLDAYRQGMVEAADACASEADLLQLLADEGVTVDDLGRWRQAFTTTGLPS